MTVVLIKPFVVAPEAESAFVQGWKATAAAFANEPGYIDTRLHRAVDPAACFRYINIAHWTSAATWTAAIKAAPPKEGGQPGIEASPALYTIADGDAVEARNGAVEREIAALENAIADAYRTNDAAILDRIMADDYRVTNGPGTVTEKAKLLADLGQRKLQVKSFRFDEMDVRTLGPDAAIALGQYTWDASYAGHPIPMHRFRYMRVYARSDGRWQVRAGQVTPVQAP